MYVLNNGTVLLHMPKTAGSTVHKAILESQDTFLLYNLRHAHISLLPDRYSDLPRYIILRRPEDWYISFYNFFSETGGFFSFIMKDRLDPNKPEEETLVSFDEFIDRSLNLKKTFQKYPMKASIVNGIIQEQETIHFMMTYFQELIGDNNLYLYDMPLYEFFWKVTGGHTAMPIPMDDKFEERIKNLFGVVIKENVNITPTKLINKKDISKETLSKIRLYHSKFYFMLGENKTVKEAELYLNSIKNN